MVIIFYFNAMVTSGKMMHEGVDKKSKLHTSGQAGGIKMMEMVDLANRPCM